jgi:thymidylate kinase
MQNTQKLIIFEGHDMAGKTTISQALSKQLNIPIIKIERNHKWVDPLVELIYGSEVHCQTAQQSGYSFIYDRLYPSEYAYSRVLGRVTAHEQILKLDERYAAMGALIVVCYKDPKAYQDDDKAIIDVAHYTALTEWYREFAKFTKCKIIFIDTTDENLEAQLETINNALNESSE